MTYTRTNPLLVSIKERYSLCKPGSQKETYHVIVDLGDAVFPYTVGDSIGIYSRNDPGLVAKTLKAMKLTGEETVIARQTERAMSLHDYLAQKASITEFSRKFLSDIKDRQTNPQKKAQLEEIFLSNETVKQYIANHEIWDLLEENQEVNFSAQEYCDLLMPNLPRLYSIASSPLVYPQEVHLTVALTEYTTNNHHRYGVCTHYLCHFAPLHEKTLPIYLQPHKGFTLPHDPFASLIMIGPGTGIAPFRAFMQERMHTHATGKNWIFFGEWTEKCEFFYEDYWKDLVMTGHLRLDTAFSRDQAHKVYVQHRMLEHAPEFFDWLQKGAYLFVCGDADRMAKDVDVALHQIVQEQGEMSHEDAKKYIKNLKMQKRYLRDVY